MWNSRESSRRGARERRQRARESKLRGELLESRQVLAGFPVPVAFAAPLAVQSVLGDFSPLDAMLGALDAAASHGVDVSKLNRALLGGSAGTATTAEVLPAIGGEFRVNSPAHGPQASFTDSAAAGNRAGHSVVVYSGVGNGDSLGVYARLYDAQGAALGAPFLVNTTSRGAQSSPVAAMSDSGAFVVVWSGKGAGDRDGIFARWYSPTGAPLTGEVLVNSSVAGWQHSPAVAMAGDGTTAIAYAGAGAGDIEGVFVRKFTSAGVAMGAAQRANTTARGEQSQPDVAINSSGETIVAWTSRHQGGFDLGVFAQRFAASGEKVGGEFQVASSGRGSQYHPSVGLADTGLAAIAWTHWSNATDLEEVHARLFESSGVALGAEFPVNVTSTGWQRAPSLAMERDGDFTIGWSSGQFDGAGWEVYARQFQASGEALAGEFQVNRESAGYASGAQSRISTALVGDGDILFVWTGRGAGDRRGVFGQRYDGEGDGLNDSPNLAPIDDREIDEGELLRFTVSATDPNGDTLTFTLDDGAPEGAAIDPVTGELTWTPSEAQGPGEYQITVLVTDNGSPPLVDSESFTVTVREVNQAPDLAPIEDRSIERGETVSFTATATDPDLPANTLTYTLDDSAPQGATIDPVTGEFTWTPTASQAAGAYTITVLVIDDGSPSLADSETFTVNLVETNLSPDLAPIENRTVEEGQTLSFIATATDPNGDELTFILDDSAPEGASIDPNSGEFIWTPTADQAPGEYEITVLVTDNGSPSLVDSETFTVTVTEINLPPDLAPIDDASIPQGQTLSFTASAIDPNLPGPTLTYFLDDGAPEDAQLDPESGEFIWSVSSEQAPGDYEITVLVTDNGSPPLVDSETFVVTVTAIEPTADEPTAEFSSDGGVSEVSEPEVSKSVVSESGGAPELKSVTNAPVTEISAPKSVAAAAPAAVEPTTPEQPATRADKLAAILASYVGEAPQAKKAIFAKSLMEALRGVFHR
jgi:hypothetical protein